MTLLLDNPSAPLLKAIMEKLDYYHDIPINHGTWGGKHYWKDQELRARELYRLIVDTAEKEAFAREEQAA